MFLLKLDVPKAFDSSLGIFLIDVLIVKVSDRSGETGYLSCLQPQPPSIAVNGELSNTIFHRRVLRRGDPLSPLMFVLIMDMFSTLLRVTNNYGILNPLGQYADSESSMYVDDVIIFTKHCLLELTTIKRILDTIASGLHTNFSKSIICPISCENEALLSLSHVSQ